MSEFASVAERRVIVTGASRGLGRAMAIGLLKAGARVTLACTGPSAPLDKTLELAAAAAPRAQRICAFGDLRKSEDCARVAAETREAFGTIDALVNNAAVPNSGDGP